MANQPRGQFVEVVCCQMSLWEQNLENNFLSFFFSFPAGKKHFTKFFTEVKIWIIFVAYRLTFFFFFLMGKEVVWIVRQKWTTTDSVVQFRREQNADSHFITECPLYFRWAVFLHCTGLHIVELINSVNSSSYILYRFAPWQEEENLSCLPSKMYFKRLCNQKSEFADVWSECDKNAHLMITAPRTMQGLSGSCLEIPCSFTPQPSEQFDGKRSTGGVWIKSDSRFAQNEDNVVFNSSRGMNAYPMKFTGDLIERNCTTLFSNLTSAYSNAYFFRVENKPFTATASCHRLDIIVRGKTFIICIHVLVLGAQPLISIFKKRRRKKKVCINRQIYTHCKYLYGKHYLHTDSTCILEDMRTFVPANYKCSCCQITW